MIMISSRQTNGVGVAAKLEAWHITSNFTFINKVMMIMVELATIITQVIVLLFPCSDVVCCIIPHGAVNMSCTIIYLGIIF